MVNTTLLTLSSSSSSLNSLYFQKPNIFTPKLNVTNINFNVLLESNVTHKLNNLTSEYISHSD